MEAVRIEKPFVGVHEASEISGLSVWFLRKEIAAGRCPSVRSGRRIYVNLPAFLEQMGVPSALVVEGGEFCEH